MLEAEQVEGEEFDDLVEELAGDGQPPPHRGGADHPQPGPRGRRRGRPPRARAPPSPQERNAQLDADCGRIENVRTIVARAGREGLLCRGLAALGVTRPADTSVSTRCGAEGRVLDQLAALGGVQHPAGAVGRDRAGSRSRRGRPLAGPREEVQVAGPTSSSGTGSTCGAAAWSCASRGTSRRATAGQVHQAGAVQAPRAGAAPQVAQRRGTAGPRRAAVRVVRRRARPCRTAAGRRADQRRAGRRAGARRRVLARRRRPPTARCRTTARRRAVDLQPSRVAAT